MASDINPLIKKELTEAKVYTDGRGIRIDHRDTSTVSDIMKLIDIKIDS
jgi:hypothetical protein